MTRYGLLPPPPLLPPFHAQTRPKIYFPRPLFHTLPTLSNRLEKPPRLSFSLPGGEEAAGVENAFRRSWPLDKREIPPRKYFYRGFSSLPFFPPSVCSLQKSSQTIGTVPKVRHIYHILYIDSRLCLRLARGEISYEYFAGRWTKRF